MPAFIPCPGVAQVEMVYQQNTQVVENVYHVHSGTAWTNARLTDLMSVFSGWEADFGFHNRVNSTQLFLMRSRDLTTVSGVVAEQSVTPPIAGEGTGESLPNNVTIAIKAYTGLAGRSFRGRTYWVGLPDSYRSGNALIPAGATALLSAMNELRTLVNAFDSSTLVVLSKRTGGAPRAAGVATPIINYQLSDETLDSQRRRLPFHNIHH